MVIRNKNETLLNSSLLFELKKSEDDLFSIKYETFPRFISQFSKEKSIQIENETFPIVFC